MSIGEQILLVIWLLIIVDGVGAALGGRAAFRIRHFTKNSTVFNWFTALGVGLWIYAISDFIIVFNNIVSGPRDYSAKWLVIAFVGRSLQALGAWTIALSLMDQQLPGILRRTIFRVLEKLGLMDIHESE